MMVPVIWHPPRDLGGGLVSLPSPRSSGMDKLHEVRRGAGLVRVANDGLEGGLEALQDAVLVGDGLQAVHQQAVGPEGGPAGGISTQGCVRTGSAVGLDPRGW